MSEVTGCLWETTEGEATGQDEATGEPPDTRQAVTFTTGFQALSAQKHPRSTLIPGTRVPSSLNHSSDFNCRSAHALD